MTGATRSNSSDVRETRESPLAVHTVSDREFALGHASGAPAASVFAAYTTPDLVSRWWDPRGRWVRVETMDLRPGGRWRFVRPLPSGQEVAYSGTYREIQSPIRLDYTFEVEGRPGIGVTATVELTEVHGTTRLTLTNKDASKEVRDTRVKHGAAAGVEAAWDRLTALFQGA
jgi:uncharacterized protein YndB with AHSA1/START domain